MDDQKIANELVKVAKDLTAISTGISKTFGISKSEISYCSMHWTYVLTFDKTAAEMTKYSNALESAFKGDSNIIRYLQIDNVDISPRGGKEPKLLTVANGNLPAFKLMSTFKIPDGAEDIVRKALVKFKFKEM